MDHTAALPAFNRSVPDSGSLLALDVGERRIGVAIASAVARLPHPYGYVLNDAHWQEQLLAILRKESVGHIVVGLPRNLSGEDTPQTAYVRRFVEDLGANTQLPISFQDEALTSRHAEDELRQRGKPFEKGDIDALAATYILDDYIKGLNS